MLRQSELTTETTHPEYKQFEGRWLDLYTNWANRAFYLDSHTRLVDSVGGDWKDYVLDESLVAFGPTLMAIYDLADGDIEDDDLPDLYESLPDITGKTRKELDKILLDKATSFSPNIDWEAVIYYYNLDQEFAFKVVEWLIDATKYTTLH